MELKFIDYINLSMGEHEALLNIRNSDYVRLEGLNTNVIAIKEHLQWVASLIKNKEKKYYAITLDGEIVGGINLFDVSHNQAHWGLFFRANINPLVPSISAYLLFDKKRKSNVILKFFILIHVFKIDIYNFIEI